MSNYLNDENKTNLLFKRFQGVAQTQIAAGATPGKAFYQEATGALQNVFQQDVFAEDVPRDLSWSCLQLHAGQGPAPPESQWDTTSNNVRKQTLGFIDMSATSFPNMSSTGQLRFYREVYLEQTPAGQGQSWYLIQDGSAVSIENNVLKDMIPWLYNDTAPQNFRPVVEYWNGTQWIASEQQGQSTGVNWLVDPASGILQFYQPQTVLATKNISAGGLTDGSFSRPRISFIKYIGQKGAGAPSGGTGSGTGSKITIGVSGESSLTTYQDVSALYFDSKDFSLNPLSASGEYVVTQVEKGGFDLSGAFFRIPDAPTIDNSGYVKENNDANIRLSWNKPFQQQSALPFGPTRYYPDGSNVIGTKNIQELPYFESLRIAYRDLSISGDWVDVSMDSTVISDKPIIPVTVNNALFGTLDSTVGDLSNSSAPSSSATAPFTTYWNDSLSSAGNYQFKIWYDNSGTEGFPTSNPYDPGDLSWNYLYIPTSSGEYLVFVGFGPATMPTDLSFQSVFYNSFDISLSNRRDTARGADASRNTPFPIPSNLSLRYKFGVSISGERDPGSLQDPNSWASEAILGGPPANGIDTSGAFQRFDNVVLDYTSFDQDISAAPQTSYTIFDEFGVTNVADFSGSSDFSYNTQFNPVRRTMVTPYPTRSDAIPNTAYRFPLASHTPAGWSAKDSGGNTVARTSAYPTTQTNPATPAVRKVYFIRDASQVTFKSSAKFSMANNYAGPWPDASMIGSDSSGKPCSYIKLGVTNQDGSANPVDSSGAPTIGFLQDPSTSIPIGSLHYDFSSQAFEVGKTPAFQNQGYYTGLDVSNITISNVSLSQGYFPDICDNNYDAYDFSMVQYRYDGTTWDTDNSAVTWKFDIAKVPEYNTTYAQTSNNSSVTLNNNFFGLMRPITSGSTTIDFSYTVNDIWKWWKKGFNMAYTELLFEWTPTPALVSSDMSGWPTSISVDTATSGQPLTLPANFYTGTQKYALVDGSGSWSNSNPQFNIKAEVSGNVLFPDLSPVITSDVSFGTPGKHLWWDYTWAGNNTVPVGINNVADFGDCEDLTGTGENLVTPTTFADTSLNYPDNSANFFSSYNHTVSLPFNQLMWCDGGFQSGYTNATTANLPNRLRPYIDFPSEFYNPGSVLKDYSALSASGEQVNYTLTPGQYYANNGTQDVSGVYKWVTVVKNNVTDTDPWRVEVTGSINNGSDTGLTAGPSPSVGQQDPGQYLVFVCERNTLYQTVQGYQYNGRSGWMDGIKKGTATNATAGSKNGEGAWATVPSGSGSRTGLRIWQASNTNPSDVFFRIGLPCQRTTPTAPEVVKITGISIGKAPLN